LGDVFAQKKCINRHFRCAYPRTEVFAAPPATQAYREGSLPGKDQPNRSSSASASDAPEVNTYSERLAKAASRNQKRVSSFNPYDIAVLPDYRHQKARLARKSQRLIDGNGVEKRSCRTSLLVYQITPGKSVALTN
jgi:hypothetical protein